MLKIGRILAKTRTSNTKVVMHSILTKLFSAAILVGIAIMGSRTTMGDEIQNVLRKLDSSYRAHDTVALVRLVASLRDKPYWSMGGGGGPTDATSLRIRALNAAASALFDQRGLLEESFTSGFPMPMTDAERETLQFLEIDPANTDQVAQLLLNPDPSIRWLGIYKTRFVSAPTQQIVEKLASISAHDNYVIISNAQDKWQGPGPEPLDSARKEFVAPLRKLAAEQLLKWGRIVSVEDSDVANAGIRRLLREYAARKNRRPMILEAVSIVASDSVANVSLRRFAPAPEDSEAFTAFKKAAKLK